MRIHRGTVAAGALLLVLTLSACGNDEPSSSPQHSQGDQTSQQDDATSNPTEEGEGEHDLSTLTVGELVYNDSGTGNPEFLGDYLLVTHEVASSYGIPCSWSSGETTSPSYGSTAVYALDETLQQYAAAGEHCSDLEQGHSEGFGLALNGVLKFTYTSENEHDGLERCSAPGECIRVTGGWMGFIDAKPEKMADAAAQQDLELQALLRAYMDAAMATW